MVRAPALALLGVLTYLASNIGAAPLDGAPLDAPLDSGGVQFSSDAHSETWATAEKKNLLEFLSRLPSALVDQDGTKPLRLYKNHKSPPENPHWPNSKVHLPSNENDARKILVHSLLHLYVRRKGPALSQAWMKLSGWRKLLFGIQTKPQNRDVRAYAGKSGLRNPQEDFVTMAQEFILPTDSTAEASIKCRTPRKFSFLRELFSDYISPLDSSLVRCKDVGEGLLDDLVFFDQDTGKPIDLGPVTMQTVKGFELLYATPGTADAAEIAGHLLLRIKLDNNPQARRIGVENQNDLVISFLADTGETATVTENPAPIKLQCKNGWVDSDTDSAHWLESIIQPIKGLSGGFYTVMDRQTLGQALQKYTVKEDRNLLRYELTLDEKQKIELLEQLFIAKKNYSTRYYFFNQNCASVLVKLIGEGIGVDSIRRFDPIVSPPNSLVALFLRLQLAKPVEPAFYSYRKRAYMAQEQIKTVYAALQQRHPGVDWPPVSALLDSRQSQRLAYLRKIAALRTPLLEQNAAVDDDLYLLLTLIQEAEQVFSRKNLACENYTTRVTASARSLQQHITISQSIVPVWHEQQADREFSRLDQIEFRQGVPHTQLFTHGVSIGQHYGAASGTSLDLHAALDRQDMGSMSRIAMQRAAALDLGGIDLGFAMASDSNLTLESWRITGIHIRKFKERLNRVPGFWQNGGNIGLGLSMLDFRGDTYNDNVFGTWLGGELLFNVYSSPFNNSFAFVSLGAHLRDQTTGNDRHTGVTMPVYFESLWTLDSNRTWQWRNQFTYHASQEHMLPEWFARSELNYRLSGVRKALWKLKWSIDYYDGEQAPNRAAINKIIKTSLGIEFNPW